jgi:protocatechuate 3,4-dioxygenase beta subunit
MKTHIELSRRRLLGMAVLAGGVSLSWSTGVAFAQELRRTPGQILGPFYPVAKPSHQGADLT